MDEEFEQGSRRTLSRRDFLIRTGSAVGAVVGAGGLTGAVGLQVAQGASKKPIVVALSTDIDVLDAQTFRNDTAYIADANLYGQLVSDRYVNHNGLLVRTGQFQGDLARSWTYSKDRKTITFKLRRGLKFADGSPLTSADLLWTWQRVFEGPGYVKAVLPVVGVTAVDYVSAPDPETFVVRRDFDSPMFIPFLAWQGLGAMPKKTAEKHRTAKDPWAAQWFAKHANSSGPYSIQSWTPGQQITMVPNKNFARRDLVANSGVIFQIVPSADSRVALVKGGSIDSAQNLPFRVLKKLESDPHVRVYQYPGRRLTYVGFNLKVAPFTDLHLRTAIQKAIPYGTLLQKVLYGFGQLSSSVVSNGMPGQISVLLPKQDLAAAKAALKKSSYKGETLTLSVRQSQAPDQESATFIQDALRSIGVHINISIVPDVQFQDLLGKKALPFFIMDWQSLGNDGFYQTIWNCKTGQPTNYTNFSDHKVDSLIEEGIRIGNPVRRAALLRELQKLWAAHVPWAPLFQQANVFLTGRNVVGVNYFYDPLQQVMYLHKA